MLTQVSEGGRDKCFQYFPLDSTKDTLTINEADEFGDGFKASIQLLELTTDERKRTTVRKLRMTVGDESRIIWHLLFSGWPDFGVPECDDRLALFELLKLSAEKNAKPENPRIIHCSAGVGRSGTFIALDHLLGELDAGTIADTKDNEDIVFDTVNELRKQRMMMVQSDTQYIFLYEVLRERLEESLTNSSAKTFESYEERSPKVARLEKDIDAGTTETSGETTDAISMSPIDGS